MIKAKEIHIRLKSLVRWGIRIWYSLPKPWDFPLTAARGFLVLRRVKKENMCMDIGKRKRVSLWVLLFTHWSMMQCHQLRRAGKSKTLMETTYYITISKHGIVNSQLLFIVSHIFCIPEGVFEDVCVSVCVCVCVLNWIHFKIFRSISIYCFLSTVYSLKCIFSR